MVLMLIVVEVLRSNQISFVRCDWKLYCAINSTNFIQYVQLPLLCLSILTLSRLTDKKDDHTVYADFSTAFDFVDHSMLLNKLQYGLFLLIEIVPKW